MTPVEFCYWLQGFFEVSEAEEVTPKQTEMIKNHLALVFHHSIDPSYTKDKSAQQILQEIHDGQEKSKKKPQYPHHTKDIKYRC